MITTEPILSFIDSLDLGRTGLIDLKNINFDWQMFVSKIGSKSFQVVNSRNGPYSIISETNDRKNPCPISGCIEFHTDGLYCDNIPDLVLMYCENPGEALTPTLFADTRVVIDKLREKRLLDQLKEIRMVYEFEPGNLVELPLITFHPRVREPIIHIGANGYVRPGVLTTSIRGITELMGEFYKVLRESVVLEHDWAPKDLLIFDNHIFVHGRGNTILDPSRKLIRLWLSITDLIEGVKYFV